MLGLMIMMALIVHHSIPFVLAYFINVWSRRDGKKETLLENLESRPISRTFKRTYSIKLWHSMILI